MAELLIKGMEMPECCYGCPLVYDMGEGNYACSFRHGYAPLNERRDDCPLVEVKGVTVNNLMDAQELAFGLYVNKMEIYLEKNNGRTD